MLSFILSLEMYYLLLYRLLWKDGIITVTYLLEHCHCDPNCATVDGKTPLDVVKKPEHLRLLLKHGATPNYCHMIKCFPQEFEKQPAEMSVKMFVLGDPGAGKSTLIKSLKTEGAMFSRIKNRFSKVTDVDERTAGIIPHDIQSKALGRITIFDFAGHKEFYAGHDALLHNSMTSFPSIILLVVEMRNGEDKIRGSLQYWLEFVSNYSISEGRSKSHLVIIGSYADSISTSEMRRKLNFIELIINNHSLNNFLVAGHVILDCRYPESQSMTQLRSVLSGSCQELRSSEEIAIAYHSFLVFLFDQFRDQPAITLGRIEEELVHKLDSDAHVYLKCVKSYDMFKLCETLNERGYILFMKNLECPKHSWIILDKSVLLSQINGVIFAPHEFREYQNISDKAGVVTLDKISSLFPKLNIDMITQFLCHLEFCQEVRDPEVLSLLQGGSINPPSLPVEKYFFFPALVKMDMPPSVWRHNDQFGYHSGWLLQCFKPEQFLSSRFLQVLLLRLAYGLVFAETDTPLSDQLFKRKCHIWKNGICWSDQAGIEVLAEIINQKSIIVLLRSLKRDDSLVRMIYMRSLIINKILSTKCELCPRIAVKESVICPEDAQHFCIHDRISQVRSVNIADIARAVVEVKVAVLDSDNQMVDIESGLLHFEPYIDFGKLILTNLFKENTDNLSVEVADSSLYSISEKIHKRTENFVKLFDPSPLSLANLMDHAPPGGVHKLVRVFQLWREEMGAEATQYNLRKKLDQYSIFAGRNPFTLCSQ